MYSLFKKIIEEFDEENYKEALKYLDGLDMDDEDNLPLFFFKITCLINLDEFGEALAIANSLIEKYPYNEVMWFEKIRCHIALDEPEKARGALKELERLTDSDDKMNFLWIARFYNQLDEPEKALEFCDRALEIDADFEDAVLEKLNTSIRLRDNNLIGEMSSKYYESFKDGNELSFMPIFTWKLMDKQYDDCLDIVAEISDNLDPEIIEMLKCGILNRMFEDNDVRLFFSNPPEVTIDEAISLMKKYFDSGVDSGEIHGVRYGIF